MIFDRTFHPDEANQAFTVGKLLETGNYTYRPEDHHGPTLYYAAAPLQKAFGHGSTAALDGTLLRCTPLLFAILGLIFGFLAIRRLTKSWLIPGLFAILLGTSPIFIFFATDFIQEMLLACFTLMMFWAGVGYLHPGGKWKPGTWALLFGVASGLAFATKETCILTFAAAGLAGLPFVWRHCGDLRSRMRDIVLATAGFTLTAILLYSSFCADWSGVWNAFIAASLSYMHRAAGDSVSTGASWHIHPWGQYLKWMFADNTPLILFVSIGIGFGFFTLFALRPGHQLHLRRTFLFLSAYSLLLFAFYSAIPYKTPWCTLQLHVCLMADALLGFCLARHLTASLNMEIGGWHPCLSVNLWCNMSLIVCAAVLLAEHIPSLITLSRDPDSKDIPYNYAAASPEVKELATTVADAMVAATNRSSAFVAVALPPEDTWPFPWYNRPYEPQTGYWTAFEDLKPLATSDAQPTVVIVPMTEGHLVQPLFPHLKNTRRFYMRPGVRVRVFW